VKDDDVQFGPTDEEFDRTVENARMLNPSSSAATVISFRPRNAELDDQVVRLDAEAAQKAAEPEGATLKDFVAYMPGHSYICTLTREMWPAASVNARIPNPEKDVTAGAWLDRNNPVEQMTWAPGEPMLIKGKVVANGGWIRRKGLTCFNLYRPPVVVPGDAALAGPWVEHIRKIYDGEGDADHIIRYFAFKVQRPEIKINHALMLGGGQGIGKDTICAPLKHAVGPWNFIEISPKHISGRFNGYAKSVLLRVSEARDLGEVNRFDFYEQMKVLTASPPEVLRVDEKHLREYDVFNCCGVIITTNYKTNGIYLPADDRRHFVAWSQARKEDFDEAYWNRLWRWYEAGGFGHVAAYLRTLDVSDFNPKAPPAKTPAFWEIVNANHAPEEVANHIATARYRDKARPLVKFCQRLCCVSMPRRTRW
jgi:hypothetical protein